MRGRGCRAECYRGQREEERSVSTEKRRVLIVGADGLRPDLVDPELMPTYAKLMAQGTRFAEHHAVYPTLTRVNMSALTSGCTPGKHGVVANVMFRPELVLHHVGTTSYVNQGNNERVMG